MWLLTKDFVPIVMSVLFAFEKVFRLNPLRII